MPDRFSEYHILDISHENGDCFDIGSVNIMNGLELDAMHEIIEQIYVANFPPRPQVLFVCDEIRIGYKLTFRADGTSDIERLYFQSDIEESTEEDKVMDS